MQNKKIGLIVGVLVLIGISFYGGNKYAQAKGGNMGNRTFAARIGAEGQMPGQRNFRNGMGGGSFVAGKILAKDANSITLETANMMGGTTQTGSKIVLYTDKVEVSKMVDGTVADLEVGKQVTVNGTPNSDGSLTAESIQLRNTPIPTPKK
jgi:hypothetical protein